jgi:hypothetical protein
MEQICRSVSPLGTTTRTDIQFCFLRLFCLKYFIKIWRRITATLREDQYIFLSHLAHFLLQWEMLQTKIVEKFKTRILYSIAAFQNRAVCEVVWEKISYSRRQATDDIRIRRMRKATHTHTHTYTHRMRNIYCFPTAITVTRTRLYVILYVHYLLFLIKIQILLK